MKGKGTNGDEEREGVEDGNQIMRSHFVFQKQRKERNSKKHRYLILRKKERTYTYGNQTKIRNATRRRGKVAAAACGGV